ncbi:MAG: hypothetical protein CFH01_01322 [Alphaproteobacteria bacterium MarineAlpha2_Bin1]|mgnify:CR=1 FL=1|nr:MAG: hypothetical protein CFH01_01322 [Alphaproteobacteria bacterium MarineAlpha2_Bin1]|tara:strand:+ start:296 stop:772 length:477 start_codon:yes stop_codon:yes gene_type:complete
MLNNLTFPVSRTTIFTEDMERSLYFWRDVLGFSITIEAKIPNPGASDIVGFNCDSIEVTVLSNFNSNFGNIGLANIIKPKIKLDKIVPSKNISLGETCIVIRTENLKLILSNLKKINSKIISLPTKLDLPIDEEVWEMFVRDPNGVLVNLSHHGKWFK